MSAPEYLPLNLQLEHIPAEHLLRVDLPRSTYGSIAELISNYPSVTREQFRQLCDGVAGSDDPNTSLSENQKLAAFEQLQADGIIGLNKVPGHDDTFSVLAYEAPPRILTPRQARKEAAQASKEARVAHKAKKGPAGPDLQLGRALLGNHIIGRLEHHKLRRGVGETALFGMQRGAEHREELPIDPAVLAWAQKRQTIAVLQPPAIDLLRPEQIDARTIKGGELFGRDSLADSVIEIYERYMAGLKNGDFTPKEAIVLKSEIARAYAQEQLEGYYPNGIPTVLLTGLTETTLQFLASREGNAVLREYQAVARDVANAKKRDGDGESDRKGSAIVERKNRPEAKPDSTIEKKEEEKKTPPAIVALKHISGAWSEDNFYQPLPRMSQESLGSVLRKSYPDIQDSDVEQTYIALQTMGILDKSGNAAKDQSSIRKTLESLGVNVPEKTVFDNFTRDEINKLRGEIRLAEEKQLLVPSLFEEGQPTVRVLSEEEKERIYLNIRADVYGRYLGRNVPLSAVLKVREQLHARLRFLLDTAAS